MRSANSLVILLIRDPHSEQEFDRLAVPEGVLEIEKGSVLDPTGDRKGEDLGMRACVNPDVPLRTLEGFIGCQGKILDVKIRALRNEAGRPCFGPPEAPRPAAKYPAQSSPSASKGREKTLLKGIAPGIEGRGAERKNSGKGITALIVLVALVPVAQNLVGLVDFLEAVLGLGIVPVRVRMILEGQFPVSDLNFALACVSWDPKNSVVVFSLHRVITTRLEWQEYR
jgi:hypothetical protein